MSSSESKGGVVTLCNPFDKRICPRYHGVPMPKDIPSQTDKRLDVLETKMDSLVTKTEFRGLETKVDNLETKVDNLGIRVGGLETKVDNLETKVDNMVTRDEFNTTMDEVLTIVRRLDQERVFTIEWVRRIEADVERVKHHLHLV